MTTAGARADERHGAAAAGRCYALSSSHLLSRHTATEVTRRRSRQTTLQVYYARHRRRRQRRQHDQRFFTSLGYNNNNNNNWMCSESGKPFQGRCIVAKKRGGALW